MTSPPAPVDALIILDGWGINPETRGNALSLADTPFLDHLEATYPATRLDCSGRAVGLPDSVMGNSEVGHMNIGAGRVVSQDLVRIDTAIEQGTLGQNPELSRVVRETAARKSSLHLMGLLSDGGVHSHIRHLFALIDLARKEGVSALYVHAILDGRDTPPTSGISYVRDLQAFLGEKDFGSIATLCGRFYAMDRDTRWDRVETAYRLYTEGQGQAMRDPAEALQAAYDSGLTDEFITPRFLQDASGTFSAKIQDTDSIIFFNFRADRAREITRAFTEESFEGFARNVRPRLSDYLCMTLYDETFTLPVIFAPKVLTGILGEVVSRHGLKQLRIAETEKYAHVTYFLNGGDETVFPLEERILVPSPRDVATYDLKPEMSADIVADKAAQKIRSRDFRLIVLNFANMDMVGHTGVIEAAKIACETVDRCVRKVVEAIWETGGTALVTADHGNAEQMLQQDGSPHTAHTLNQVRFILAGEAYRNASLRHGVLGDIAPTLLKVMELDQPPEMTGKPLF